MSKIYKLSYTASEIDKKLGQIDNLAQKSEIPTKISGLENDLNFLTEHQDLSDYAKKTDIPTSLPASDVYDWAKASTKPSYTASEVGLGNVDNVRQYSVNNPPPYPVTSVNGKTGSISLTASDVSADASGTANSVVSSHNTSTSAHSDIRAEINDLSEKNDSMEKDIIDIKANKVQQTPLFANSIDECTDTSKVYVLPDGNIYGYIYQLVDTNVNEISLSIDSDGKPYVGANGEIGYSVGVRLGASGVIENSTIPNLAVTGFIPVSQYLNLYFKNFNFIPNSGDSNMVAVGYDASFNHVEGITAGSDFSPMAYLFGTTQTDENGKIIALTNMSRYNGIKYVRFCCIGLDSAIISRSPIVEPSKQYEWTSTGHSFIPADYEDRIIKTEEDLENHEERIRLLENYEGSNSSSPSIEIPAYIKEEAENVMSRLMEKQGNRVFNMVAMSDFHYTNYHAKYPDSPVDENYLTLVSAAKATSYMLDRIHIDAVATLGDNTPFGAVKDSDIVWGHKWHKEINEILSITQRPGVIDFRTVGNHDRMGGKDTETNEATPIMPDGAIYQYIQGYNRQCDYLSAPVGYGYKDFEGYKLRVIVLNTAECEGKTRFSEPHYGYFIGNAQYNWLINKALDMSSKADASEWQILILSHHRADDAQVAHDGHSWQNNAFILPNILNAYKTGGSYSGTIAEEGISVSCNFAGKNQATLIGQIHGHHHNHKYSNLYLGAHDNSTLTNIMAVGTPSTRFDETNPDNDENVYTGELGTAEETCFSVYAIDLDAHKIYSINYGRGIDREINY